MKKYALVFSFFAAVIMLGAGVAPAITRADTGSGFVPLAPIPGLNDSIGSTVSSANLATFLNQLYIYLIGASAILAVIMIIWGGLQISTQDSVSKQGEGRQRIQQALFGLVLVLSPVLIFTIINPKILDLSLALPPLDVHTGSMQTNQSVTQQTPTDPGTYTVIKDGEYLKEALAADQAGYDKFFAEKCQLMAGEKTTSCGGAGLKNNAGCVDGTVASCGQRLNGITSYYWKYWCAVGTYGCVGDKYVDVIPSDSQKVQAFISGCQNDGGKIYHFVDHGVQVPVVCTDTTGFQPYDANQYSGYSCVYNDYFECRIGT